MSITRVTRLVQDFFQKFDQEEIITNMKASLDWGKSQYYGMSDQEIKNKWQLAAQLGTLLHEDIESYFKSGKTSEKVEFNQFLNFHSKMVREGYNVFMVEKQMCSKKYPITGIVDAVYKKDNDYILVDWKRVQSIKNDTFRLAKHPINHYYDNSLVKYSLQLNFYKYILAEHNINVSGLYLVQLYPGQEDYNLIKAQEIKEVDDILKFKFGI